MQATLKTPPNLTIPLRVLDAGRGGAPLEWDAEVEWIGLDVMLVRNAFGGLLSDAVALCEEHGVWKPSQCVDGEDETASEYDDATRTSDACQITYNGHGEQPHEALQRLGLFLMSVEGHFVLAYQQGNPYATVGGDQYGGTSGYEMLRYREGELFAPHVDTSRACPILSRRRLSAVAYANDDYEGGELYFPRQDIVVPKEAGSLCLFPSGFTHPHESRPVTSGVKYSAVTWYF